MKPTTFLNRTILATLLVTASVSVFAAGGGPRGSDNYPHSVAVEQMGGATNGTSNATTASVAYTSTPQSAANDNASGKTRAQVRAELIEAEREGLVPDDNTHYPPDETTVARNKVAFNHAEKWWLAHQQSLDTAKAVPDGETDAIESPSSQGKSREQVRAELIQAEEAGLLPASYTRNLGDPSTVARNKVTFQKAKSWWEAHGQGPTWAN